MKIAPVCRRPIELVIAAPGIALVLAAALLCTACEKKAGPAESSTYHYEARGLIRGLPPDHKTIGIQHEDIPGFMPSMTMPFEVRDEKEFANLQLGDAISFRLNVTQRDSWIDRIQKIDTGQLHLPTQAPAPPKLSKTGSQSRLHEGDAMPDFKLTDQEGKPVILETLRDHPFVVTFIFTRCPLPNFCPRMSQNFAELQAAIQASSDPLSSARLLSISFDPAFDTTEVLKQYAEHAGADPAIWSFATGDPAEIQKLTKAFSIFVQPEGGTISHGLATALVDGHGKIVRIWRGNGWTPAEVMLAAKTP
jgi:protein SCO1